MREERTLRQLHNLYFLGNITRVIKSRKMRWARYVTRAGVMTNVNTVLGRKPERIGSLGRHRSRHADKMV
jgi:hypothetical protein